MEPVGTFLEDVDHCEWALSLLSLDALVALILDC